VSDERARLFVALQLPEHAREALTRWRSRALRCIDGLRLVAPDDLHVTLCFLGWRAVGEIEEILDACRVAESAPVAELRAAGAIWLPPRRPRVLAVEFDDVSGALGRAQAALSDALSAGGWYAPEARPFLAHVTVARVSKGARLRARELAALPAVALTGSCVTLYRSRLSPGGARYEPLGQVALGSAAPRLDPVSVVQRFHAEQARAYAGDGMASVRELLRDDVVWHVPGRSAIAGEHRGAEAVLDYLDLRRRMTDASFRVVVHGIAPIGDRIVQLAGGRAQRDGRDVTWETVGVFRVRSGQIAECWLVPFDQSAFDEIWS
jgi:2'-5' RNA ligase